jgi:putative transposase
MARPLRIAYPGALYHLTSRGNARQPIFLDDGDRRLFLHHLGEVVGRSRWRCRAFCLMTNHYHLLVETPEANVSRGMQRLNSLYSQGFNARHERVGHVLQGRFTGILVEQEEHELELARYVVLNPVRASLVAGPEEYPWSSLRATLGLDPCPEWLDAGSLRAAFGSRARYLEFVRAGIGRAAPWSLLRGVLLGSDEFVARLAPHVDPRLVAGELPREQRLGARPSLEVLLTDEVIASRRRRNEAIRELAHSGRYSMAEIARHLGLHYSTVSRIVGGAVGGSGLPPADVRP